MAKILLIDDSKVQRHWTRDRLSDPSYEFIEGGDGKEGLELMQKYNPDIIVCDLNMPIMGGIECMETMKTKGINLPVIVLTTDIQDITKERCLNLGAKGFVHKPLNDDTLPSMVRKILKDEG